MNSTDLPDPPEQSVCDIPAVRWLAGMAMQGLVSRHGVPDSEGAREEFALWSYRMAQSMLAVESQLHAIDKKSPSASAPA